VAVSTSASGRAQPALRIEQEHASGDDSFAFLETASDFHAIRQLHAEHHGARLKSITRGDKHVLLHTGIHHRVTRHGDDRRSGRFKGGGAVQARPEPAAGVGRREADPQCARAVGQRRLEEIDPGGKGWTA
jgi:hypothetical protein